MGNKSCLIAYCLWLFGGWYGLHHFYLGRDRHALVWWMTAGGLFGLGCFRDLFRISDYVAAANRDPNYIEWMKGKFKYYPKPQFSIVRFAGELSVGWLLGILVYSSLPEEIFKDSVFSYFRYAVVPLGIAVGVHLVGNIGHEKVSLRSCIIGAYLLSPMYWYNVDFFNHCVLLCATYANWKGKSWRLDFVKEKKSTGNTCKRILILALCGGLYSGLWSSTLFHNAYVSSADGEQIRLKDALRHFFTSPAWAETKHTAWNLYDLFMKEGFPRMWQELNASLDPEGEYNAYRILGLRNGASDEEITAAYRALVRKWHPDKIQDPAMKKVAEKKFLAIQHAYEILSSIKHRRTMKNMRNRNNPGRQYP